MKQYKKFMDGAFAPYYSDEVFTETMVVSLNSI